METFPPTSDSSRAAVGGRQKDGHLVLVNGLEAYKSGNSVVRGTNRLQNDLNCVDGGVIFALPETRRHFFAWRGAYFH